MATPYLEIIIDSKYFVMRLILRQKRELINWIVYPNNSQKICKNAKNFSSIYVLDNINLLIQSYVKYSPCIICSEVRIVNISR